MSLTNISHPLRSARKAKSWFAAHVHMWRFGNHGRRRFKKDPRYDLQQVTAGFANRIDEASDDTPLLERICAAYNKAESEPHSVLGAYIASESVRRLRQGSLSPSIRALIKHETVALGEMYRNFYRDPCSAGLLAAPQGMSKAYFGPQIKDIYRHFYLSHVLYRLDYWKSLTSNRFSLKDLAGSGIGNPFGVVIDGTHITVGAEYSHYCAQRVAGLVDRFCIPHSTVAEIGGGFGAVAYYLLRDHRPLTYFDFDVPERIALSSYHLMKAFPHLTFLLYGEKSLTQDALSEVDVALLPISALAAMQNASIDITFSSNGVSNLSAGAMTECLQRIAAITRHSVLYIANQSSSELIGELLGEGANALTLMDRRTSGWHSHRVSGAGVGGAAALANSTLIEQTFSRKPAVVYSAVDAPVLAAREGAHGAQR
ncbi:putative sugar O-methyltransferase [Tunturibacter empetritectus]|uniref:Sugar O-methyltransferase n=1 Tax=Tunturiibacter empetritectus TaxID=3069691 RepID=A0A7W8MPK9_9BACT|nr:putative sugar O-methyltransferase [Edaphobacter lichenicola]MBB5315568.1 putative sugar O-methyltransferase [Edaphobacter lichenicola]